ncbi:MAG: hypothetical protein WC447_00025 [Candidatus Paceibacterota bacterium]|jgi:hypothetical protein
MVTSSVKKTIYSFLIIFIILSSFFLPEYSKAYTKTNVGVTVQNDFVVEPGKTEVFLNPGEKMVKNISVTNRVDKAVRFKLTTEDFVGTNDPNQPVLLMGDTNSPYSLKDFIVPEITEFSLEFGEKITIPVTISVPLNAEPRGYYGALIISNDPDKLENDTTKETEGKTRIISRIGSLFLLKINGEGKEEGKVEDFKLIGPEKIFYSQRPEGFEIAYKNTGNVHLVPYGTITIKNIFGKVLNTLPVDAYFVLPDSIRYREVKWTDGFSLGRYTANLSLNKGYGNQYENIDLAFWVLPWKILLIGFVSLFLIIALIYYFLTRFELRKK